MKKDRKTGFDVVRLVLQPYVIDILKALERPKRFVDLKKIVKNERTLSLKLSTLLKYELIEVVPIKTDERYVNAYRTSKEGRKVVRKLEGMLQ